eukprot:8917191-Karenia_brevis.AAC.1
MSWIEQAVSVAGAVSEASAPQLGIEDAEAEEQRGAGETREEGRNRTAYLREVAPPPPRLPNGWKAIWSPENDAFWFSSVDGSMHTWTAPPRVPFSWE